MAPNAAAGSSIRPSGSSAPASKPQAITISSGANASSAGTTTRSSASRYAPVPDPAGSGTLRVVPAPGAGAGLARGARSARDRGRPGAGRSASTEGSSQKIGLGAVAVVNVPVDDGDTTDARARLRVPDADGDVREEAEPHAEVGQGVVAGRADERIGVVDGAVEHGVDRGDRAPGGEPGDLEGAVAEGRLAAGVPAAAGRELHGSARRTRGVCTRQSSSIVAGRGDSSDEARGSGRSRRAGS